MQKTSSLQSRLFRIIQSFQFAWVCLLGFVIVGIDLFYSIPIEIPLLSAWLFLCAGIGFWFFAQNIKKIPLWQSLSFILQAIFLAIYSSNGSLSPLHGLLFIYALVPGSFFLFQEKKTAFPIEFFFLSVILLTDEILLFAKNQISLWTALSIGILLFLLVLPWFFKKQQKSMNQQDKNKQFQNFIEALHQKAFAYRLKPSIMHFSEKQVTPLQGSLLLISQVQQLTSELLCQATHADTCILYWIDENRLKLQATVSSNKQRLATEIPVDAGGIIGTLQKSDTILNLSTIRTSHLPYYPAEFKNQGAFLAIPFFVDHVFYGFLALERWAKDSKEIPSPFHQEDEALLQKASLQILTHIKSEQLFSQAERSLDAQSHLYQASALLNQALTAEQVQQASFQAALQICSFDMGVLTHFDDEKQTHQVVALSDEQGTLIPQSDWLLYTFPQNTGLVATSLKNQVMLPDVMVSYQPDMLVFDEQFQFQGIRSVLVIPLLYMGKPMGAWVLASRQEQAFEKSERKIMEILANHVSISLENARRYQVMEAMATTDGLTQLLNRRTWQDRFPEMLERAERHQKPVTVLMTDIDFFKKINDTHGHPAGDAVLKQVAQVVQSCIRKVDLAARYGGEEFVIVLDGADTKNAFQLAERVRKEVENLELSGSQGIFHCTLSIGMSTFPVDGKDLTTLLYRADQALYKAKHQGRNQTIAYTSTAQAS